MLPNSWPEPGAAAHLWRSITADGLAGVWPGVAVVDVRTREEHSIARIPGSLNIPLDELPARLSDLPNTTLYVLCGSGKRSSQAVRMLTERGYSTVNVAGGITEWYRSGHPVTYSPPSEIHPKPKRPHPLLSHLDRFRNWFARHS